MPECPATVLTGLIREDAEKLLAVLAENVEALVGQSVEIQALDPGGDEVAKAFGGTGVYRFPVTDGAGQTVPSLIALDFEGAVHLGAAFSLMGVEQVKEVLSSKTVPEILHDAVGEVANILCGASVNVLRDKAPDAPELRRDTSFGKIEAPCWPSLLATYEKDVPWDLAAGRLLIGGEAKGALLVASSDGESGCVAAEDVAASREALEKAGALSESGAAEGAGAGGAATADRPTGETVHLACHPADTSAFVLRNLLESSGRRVVPARARDCAGELLFVVSRSPTDMRLRLSSLAEPLHRPAVVVAASDRPTRELVVASREGRADAFIVLPTTAEKVAEILRGAGVGA